ncbi:MAG: hypothetical protein IRY90_15120 [Actinomadura rubrobrunea]|nr:hypothetical protein [Actinomadura rubrobrunea]
MSWAAYGTLLGLVGGSTFVDAPVRGVALALGLAVAATVVVEVARCLRRRRCLRETSGARQLADAVGAVAGAVPTGSAARAVEVPEGTRGAERILDQQGCFAWMFRHNHERRVNFRRVVQDRHSTWGFHTTASEREGEHARA